MMRTTILVTAVLVSMLSASAVYAQRVETDLVDGHPVINCNGMSPSAYTTTAKGNTHGELSTVAANEKVYKRFAVSNEANGNSESCLNGYYICAGIGDGWRLPTQRELMLIWILRRRLESTSGFVPFEDNYYYWCASVLSGSKGMLVNTSSGIMVEYNQSVSAALRCVRELVP